MNLRTIVASLLLVVATTGTAAAQFRNGPNYLTYDLLNRLNVIDMEADRLQEWSHVDAINNQALGMRASDSTAMLDTRGWKHMGLWVRAVCTGAAAGGTCDSLRFALLAIQVRGGIVAVNDSINAHPWTRGHSTPTAQGVDTLGATWAVPDSTPIAGNRWQRFADPATEQVLWANTNPDKQTMPYGSYFPLVDHRTGVWWSSPYTSIRVRYMRAYDHTHSEVGFNTNALPIKLKVDLVGWR